MLRRWTPLRGLRPVRAGAAVAAVVAPHASFPERSRQILPHLCLSRRLYATESAYDIDLISLTKTPRPAPPVADFPCQKSRPLDRQLVQLACDRQAAASDPKIGAFFSAYARQLAVFEAFVARSYDAKISRVAQLTAIEVLNCLYIFRDSYSKNKVPAVAAAEVPEYDAMFADLLALVKARADSPRVLGEMLAVHNFGLDLLSHNLANYVNELESLHKEFNLGTLTSVGDIAAAIEAMVADFSRFLASNNNLNYNDEFFKLYIQINKYNHLKTLLAQFDAVAPADLLTLLRCSWFMDVAGDLPRGGVLNLNLAKFVLDDNLSQMTYVEVVDRLYHYRCDDAELQKVVSAMFNDLLSKCCNGEVDYFAKCTDGVYVTKFVVSDDPLLNCEFSALYEAELAPFVPCLRVLGDKLGRPFVDCSPVEISDTAWNMSFDHLMLDSLFNRFRKNLNTFFEVVEWNPRSLDKLATYENWADWLNEHQHGRMQGKRLTMADYTGSTNRPYKVISLDTQLAEFLPELAKFSERFPAINLSCFTLREVFNLMKEQYPDASEEYAENLQFLVNDYKRLSKLNLDLVQKRDELGKSFVAASADELAAIGLPTDVDSLIYENMLKLQRSKKKPVYVQLPDDLEMHRFTEELTNVKNTELKRPFSQCSAAEVESAINKRIDSVLNGDFSNDIYNKESIYRYVKLVKRLSNLFNVNGSNTNVLDTVIFSQSVFDSFEKKKKAKVPVKEETPTAKIYKQIPDHFNLEEYMIELMQLKHRLGGDFKEFEAQRVLDLLKAMSLDEKAYNMNKRIILSKLYRNLSLLFKHNDNETFVLDNVLLNNEVFQQFESDAEIAMTKKLDKFEQLVKDYTEHLKFFLIWNKLDKADLVDFYELSHDDFKEKCDKFIKYIEANDAYQLPAYKSLVESLKNLNFNEFELPILMRIHELKAKNEKYMLEDVKKEVETFMETLAKNRDLFESEVGEQKYKSSIKVPVKEEKFDLNEFIDDPKVIYNDPSHVAAQKEEESALDESELFIRNQIFHLRESEDKRYTHNSPDVEDLMELTPEKIRSAYRKPSDPKPPPVVSDEPIDEGKVQDFLEGVNRQKKIKEQSSFREKQAYEWSKNNNAHRSLEVKNFFDPQTEVVGGSQYLLLSANGDQVLMGSNPLSKKFKHEEIFGILNNYDKDELRKIMKTVKKLQKKNWQLIGGGGEGDKMLVFVKHKKSNGGIFTKVKTIFAMAGATFTILMALNWWLGDEPSPPPPPPVVEEAQVYERNEAHKVDAPSTVNDNTSNEGSPKGGWFWR